MNLDIQLQPDPYFNVGFHLDHKNGRVELHFPSCFMAIGNVNNIELDWSLKRFIRRQPNYWKWKREAVVMVECNQCGHVWQETSGEIEGCPNCGLSRQNWRAMLTDDDQFLLSEILASDSHFAGSQLVKNLARVFDEITA